MLTRIEIDGFKSFEDFAVDLNPFAVVVGANASGKSNLFDAIRLLSLLATTDVRLAFKLIRGEPHELFRIGPDGTPGTRMSFAVEVLLEPSVRDSQGGEAEITQTRVRYEIEIERSKDDRGIERLVIAREQAMPIPAKADRWLPWGQEPSEQFRGRHLKYRRTSPLLTTVEGNGYRSFYLTHRGISRSKRVRIEKLYPLKIRNISNQGHVLFKETVERTVLSGFDSVKLLHILGLREELRSWRFFHPDPVAMRQPSPMSEDDELKLDGSNLAAVLDRIAYQTGTAERPRGLLSEIVIDLAGLIPGLHGLDIVKDEDDRECRIDFAFRAEAPVSARIVSDGTLRLLAMLTFLHDPDRRGLVCFEEPENGVHPGRLEGLIGLVREHLVAPFREGDAGDEPLSQVIFNSHSPVVLAHLEDPEMMFADMVDVVDPAKRTVTRKTRFRPVGSQGGRLGHGQYVSRHEVDRYLATAKSGL